MLTKVSRDFDEIFATLLICFYFHVLTKVKIRNTLIEFGSTALLKRRENGYDFSAHIMHFIFNESFIPSELIAARHKNKPFKKNKIQRKEYDLRM